VIFLIIKRGLRVNAGNKFRIFQRLTSDYQVRNVNSSREIHAVKKEVIIISIEKVNTLRLRELRHCPRSASQR
jgi:hypothetical protein